MGKRRRATGERWAVNGTGRDAGGVRQSGREVGIAGNRVGVKAVGR